MPIQQIHVENFKSFLTLDIELSRFNVVIGSNAAGKSNFISIFKFLRDIARHGLADAIALQGGFGYILNAKIGNNRDLVIRVSYTPDQKLDIIDQKSGENALLGLQLCESSYEFAIRFDASGEWICDYKRPARDRMRGLFVRTKWNECYEKKHLGTWGNTGNQ